VTHDQEEALELADRVVVMRDGGIEQVGSPRAIYDHPQTQFVYEFLGSANRIPCRVREGWIEVEGARWPAPADHAVGDGDALLFVRPQDLALARGFTDGIPARLDSVVTTGPAYRLVCKFGQAQLSVEVELTRSRFDALHLRPGAPVVLQPQEFGLFPAGDVESAASVSVPEAMSRPREAVA
jgi:sulfate transport system ATP-binding protein